MVDTKTQTNKQAKRKYFFLTNPEENTIFFNQFLLNVRMNIHYVNIAQHVQTFTFYDLTLL